MPASSRVPGDCACEPDGAREERRPSVPWACGPSAVACRRVAVVRGERTQLGHGSRGVLADILSPLLTWAGSISRVPTSHLRRPEKMGPLGGLSKVGGRRCAPVRGPEPAAKPPPSASVRMGPHAARPRSFSRLTQASADGRRAANREKPEHADTLNRSLTLAVLLTAASAGAQEPRGLGHWQGKGTAFPVAGPAQGEFTGRP